MQRIFIDGMYGTKKTEIAEFISNMFPEKRIVDYIYYGKNNYEDWKKRLNKYNNDIFVNSFIATFIHNAKEPEHINPFQLDCLFDISVDDIFIYIGDSEERLKIEYNGNITDKEFHETYIEYYNSDMIDMLKNNCNVIFTNENNIDEVYSEILRIYMEGLFNE